METQGKAVEEAPLEGSEKKGGLHHDQTHEDAQAYAYIRLECELCNHHDPCLRFKRKR